MTFIPIFPSEERARQLLPLGIFLGLWFLLALLTLGDIVANDPMGESRSKLYAMARMVYFIFWALLSLPLWWFIGRFLQLPLTASIFALTGLGLATTSLTGAAEILTREWIIHIGPPNHPLNFFSTWFGRLHLELVLFVVLVCGRLAFDFYGKYRERQKQANALRQSLMEARLQALQMQLQPHFLFNTLNTVSALVEREPRTTRDVIAKLGDLLRDSLNRGETAWSTLADELAFLENYLGIERVRFGGNLKVNLDIAPETRNLLIPSLILQPLVENAVKHGIAKRANGGSIEVRSFLEENTLVLRIEDDGPGPFTWPPVESIGLRNIRERLETQTANAGILCCSKPETGGFRSEIRLPRDCLGENTLTLEGL